MINIGKTLNYNYEIGLAMSFNALASISPRYVHKKDIFKVPHFVL